MFDSSFALTAPTQVASESNTTPAIIPKLTAQLAPVWWEQLSDEDSATGTLSFELSEPDVKVEEETGSLHLSVSSWPTRGLLASWTVGRMRVSVGRINEPMPAAVLTRVGQLDYDEGLSWKPARRKLQISEPPVFAYRHQEINPLSLYPPLPPDLVIGNPFAVRTQRSGFIAASFPNVRVTPTTQAPLAYTMEMVGEAATTYLSAFKIVLGDAPVASTSFSVVEGETIWRLTINVPSALLADVEKLIDLESDAHALVHKIDPKWTGFFSIRYVADDGAA